jgi:DNA damage-binding protein 1
LCFLPSDSSDEPILALIHRDVHQNSTLLARTLSLPHAEVDPIPCTILPQTVLPAQEFPFPSPNPPVLVPLPPQEGAQVLADGGVLVLGGRTIALYTLADAESQVRRRAKLEKTAKEKAKTGAKADAAKQKERKREEIKRNARVVVDWPWSEVTACVGFCAY